MKKTLLGIFTGLLAIFAISACNKFGDLSGQDGKLVANKYKVKINEPDSLLLVGSASTDSVKWNVVPAGYDSLITKGGGALIFFKKAGSYQVTAKKNASNSATASITVSDSVYYPAGQYNITPFTGDEITLVPHYYKNAAADSTYLYFIAQTKNHYCEESTMEVADSLINGKYGINFINVKQPKTCVIGEGQLGWAVKFPSSPNHMLSTGTFPLAVTLNGVNYTGSIVVTSSAITYNWNYASGVLILPKQINR